MKRPLFLILANLLLVDFALAPSSHAQTDHLDGMDSWIESEMERWQIPGLAVSVVRNDSVIYARGFGVLGLDDPRPVDEHTLFGAGSTTKAMTAAAVALMVDAGRLGWDDPVVKHIPSFALSEPYATRSVTVRDLLVHRVGVGRITGNRLQYLTSRPRSELLYRMRFHEFEEPFRTSHVYSNAMYTVAGEVAGAAAGKSWDDVVVEQIFQPLGMTRSNTTATAIKNADNAAWPHQEIDGKVVSIPRRSFDAAGPAGSVSVSAWDMAQWMRLHLGEPGVHDGRRLFSDAVMMEMHSAQFALGGSSFDDGSLAAYGLGWRISSRDGRTTAGHGGSMDGMNASLLLVPSEDLGVFAVANVHNNLISAIVDRIVDVHLGVAGRDRAEESWRSYRSARARVEVLRDSIHAGRVPGTTPTLSLDRYVGVFVDSLYADAEVRREGDGLVLQFWDDPGMIADLEHWHHDTFRAVFRNRAMREEWLWFDIGRDGRVATLNYEWNLRPMMLQVGAYPSHQTRVARMTPAN